MVNAYWGPISVSLLMSIMVRHVRVLLDFLSYLLSLVVHTNPLILILMMMLSSA